MTQLYTTDLKYLIPLLGVLIGWLLTSLTGFLKSVSDKQKILGKTLMQLHFFYLEQIRVLHHFEYLKDNFGINQKYEAMRFRAMQRYVLDNNNFKTSIETISELATVYPMTAMRLKLLVENFSFSQKMTFSASSSSPEIYVKLLSMFEVAFELEHSELKKIIFKVAWGHSFITWIQMKWKYYKMNKQSIASKLTKAFGLDEDLKKIISDEKEKVEEQNK